MRLSNNPKVKQKITMEQAMANWERDKYIMNNFGFTLEQYIQFLYLKYDVQEGNKC